MNRAIISTLHDAQERGETVILATVMRVAGSTPRQSGARMVIRTDKIVGTIGGGAIEYRVMNDARNLLKNPEEQTAIVDVHLVRDLGMCCGGRMMVFLEKVFPEPRLWLFGAGHVINALAVHAKSVGFQVNRIVCGQSTIEPVSAVDDVVITPLDPVEYAVNLTTSSNDYLVIMTRDHALDFAIAQSCLSKDLAYLGMIGSRSKRSRFENLVDEAQKESSSFTQHLQCPIGLDIGAISPEEISISVMAQLIARRRKGLCS